MSNLQVVVELIDKMTGPLSQLTGILGAFADGMEDGMRKELKAAQASEKNADAKQKVATSTNKAEKSSKDNAKAVETEVSKYDKLIKKLDDTAKTAAKLYIFKQIWDVMAANVQAADRMDDLKDKTGIAADKLKDYQYAADQAGTSLEGLMGGLNKLNQSIAKSEEETTKQARAFELLGISTTNADGSLKSSEETFGAIADKFKDLKDGPEKAALAFAIFGQQGKDLIPLLNRGSDGIKALREESEQLGQMGPAAYSSYAKAAGDLMDNIGRLNTMFQGFVSVIMSEVVPAVNVVIDEFVDSFKAGGLVAQILDGIKVVAINAFIPAMKAVVVVLRGVADAVTLAGKGLGALGAMIAAVASGDLQGAKSIWQAYKDDVANTASEHVKFTEKLWDASNASGAMAATIDNKATPSIKGLSKATKDGKTSVSEYEKAIVGFNNALKAIQNDGAVAAYQASLIAAGYSIDDAANKALARKNALEQLNKENAGLKADKKPARTQEQNDARLQELEKLQMVAIASKKIGEGKVKYEEQLRETVKKIKAGAYGDLVAAQKKEIDLVKDARARGEISEKAAQEEYKAIRAKYGKEMLDIATKNDAELRNVVTTTNDIIAQSYGVIEASVEENIQVANGLLFNGRISQDDYNRYVAEQHARLTELTKKETDQITIFWQEAAKNMQSAMADTFFDVMQGKMTDLGKTFKQMIDRMVANALAANLNDALFGQGFGKTGNMGGLIGKGLSWLSGFAGARASGGPVEAGKAYLVGEKGPEPFIPKVSGTIMPNSSLSSLMGSGGNTVQVNITAMDSQDVRRALEKDSRWLADMVRKTGRTYNLGT